MPNDPKDRRTPPHGHRAITERGGGQSSDERDRHIVKHPQHDPPRLRGQAIPPYVEHEMTPVTMITLVREELKDDIATVDEKVEKVSDRVLELDTSLNSAVRSVERLTGEVATTNRLIPTMLETIKDELRAKRTIDEHAVITKLEVTKHREITEIDETAADRKALRDDTAAQKRAQRKALLKVITALTSTGVITALLTLLASGRC